MALTEREAQQMEQNFKTLNPALPENGWDMKVGKGEIPEDTAQIHVSIGLILNGEARTTPIFRPQDEHGNSCGPPLDDGCPNPPGC